jgi:hypothetical protein
MRCTLLEVRRIPLEIHSAHTGFHCTLRRGAVTSTGNFDHVQWNPWEVQAFQRNLIIILLAGTFGGRH